MRICLYGNPAAGGGTSLDELTAIIVKAGHDVVSVIDDVDDARALLESNLDCVAAAGGDGTIARAARMLIGKEIPLAMLPVGTANNIARSLGIEGEPEQLIARWQLNRVGRIDVGVVEDGETRSYFLESVGCGLVTECIAEGRATLAKDHPQTHLAEARELYTEALSRLEPLHCDLQLDDEAISGDFLVLEALNTPSIGPRIEFAADVNAADGLLSVVAITAAERERVERYLAALRAVSVAGSEVDAGFRSWRVRSVGITGASRIHIDDQVVEVRSGRLAVSVLPSALAVLT
jgi:diacylglycerol kinase family enzyme